MTEPVVLRAKTNVYVMDDDSKKTKKLKEQRTV